MAGTVTESDMKSPCDVVLECFVKPNLHKLERIATKAPRHQGGRLVFAKVMVPAGITFDVVAVIVL